MADGSDPAAVHRGPGATDHPVARCPVTLHRCCGEGIVRCQRPALHQGMHASYGPYDRFGIADVVEW